MNSRTQGSSSAIENLLGSAQQEGTLSVQAAQAINIADIGEQIQQGIGIDVSDVRASQVTLVSQMPDDSGSIRFAGHAQLVRDGHNEVLDALGGSKQKDGILAHTLYLNGHVLFPYAPLDQAVRMTQQNYDPNGSTPLYDQTAVFLGTVLLKAQSFEDSGVPCRTVSLILSDGADEHSRRHTAQSVRPIVEDMLRAENHIIAAMGINDGHTDFRKVFGDMGIPPEWILTPGRNAKDIRSAFRLFSQSAVRASQSAASFSKTAAGGFGS